METLITSNENMQQQSAKPEMLPYALPAMIIGIVSLVVFCYMGWIMAIVGLNLWKKAKAEWDANPGKYSLTSFKMANAGRICSTIGIIVGLVAMVYWVVYFIFIIGIATHSYRYF
jgi:hypothetical protein